MKVAILLPLLLLVPSSTLAQFSPVTPLRFLPESLRYAVPGTRVVTASMSGDIVTTGSITVSGTVTTGHLETGSIRAADGTTAATIESGTGDVVVTSGLSVPRVDLGSENEVIGSLAGYESPGSNNSFFGHHAGSESPGDYSSFFGWASGAMSPGDYSSVFGFAAGTLSPGNSNSFFGGAAGTESPGNYNSFFGWTAGAMSPGDSNNFFGRQAGSMSPGNDNSFFGQTAGYGSPGNRNVGLGTRAGVRTEGNDLTIIGYNRGTTPALRTASRITSLGSEAVRGYIDGAADVLALGYRAGYLHSDQTNRAYIGGWDGTTAWPFDHHWEVTSVNAKSHIENFHVNRVQYSLPLATPDGDLEVRDIASSGSLKTGSIKAADGTTAATIAAGTGAVVITSQLSVPRADLGTNNLVIGDGAGASGNGNSVFGPLAGAGATGDNNSFFGWTAGWQSPGDRNSSFGYYAGRESPGSNNNSFGCSAGFQSPGGNNNFFGFEAGFQSPGDSNNFFGLYAGYTSPGSRNLGFGTRAVIRTEGDDLTIVGYSRSTLPTLRTASRITALGSEAVRDYTDGAADVLALGYRAGYLHQDQTNRCYIGGWDGTTAWAFDHHWEVTSVSAMSHIENFHVNRTEYNLPLVTTDGDLKLRHLDMAGYIDLAEIAEPDAPSAGSIRLYADSMTGLFTVKNSAGTTVAVEFP